VNHIPITDYDRSETTGEYGIFQPFAYHDKEISTHEIKSRFFKATAALIK
jgi:hypothetical protein